LNTLLYAYIRMYTHVYTQEHTVTWTRLKISFSVTSSDMRKN